MFISLIFSVFYSKLSFDGFLILLYCSKIKHYGDELMISGRSSSACTSAAHFDVVLSFDSVRDGCIDVHDNRPQ
jgi:hypothetical protein